MKPARRDNSRRVTPDLLDFYIKRGHELHAEAWRNTMYGLLALLKRLWR